MSVIRFDNVSKTFVKHAGQLLLRERIRNLLNGRRQERFQALRDVTFRLEHGDSLAVIGPNGAGKSTLLSVAAGLTLPSEGKIEVRGRLAAVLDLGAGFHPDLSGGENVIINAAILGLSRQEIRQRFDAIVEFSGIPDFMDEPLRTYSAGMQMRLAFSVAIHVEPDILVVDEVLGVGDEAFFHKCVAKIMDFRRAGKTILCASHSAELLKLFCPRAIWLDHGTVVQIGPLDDVVEAYREYSVCGKIPCPPSAML